MCCIEYFLDDYAEQSKGDSNDSESPQKTYNLKNSVQVWSDYLSTHLHPKSLYMLSDIWHQNTKSSKEEEYWGFMPGQASMKKETNQEEIYDRIRLLAECCGSLQVSY